MKKYIIALLAIASAAFFSGCSPMVYVNPHQLSVDEIITMSNQGVGKDVITQYINSTHSRFNLTAEDIIKLTQAKVDPDVIKSMIKSENQHYSGGWNYGYSSWGYPYRGYSYWGYPYFYNNWYGYPYYYSYSRPSNSYYYHGYGGHGYGNYRGGAVHQRGYGGRGGFGRR
jgi:hypothetical protein